MGTSLVNIGAPLAPFALRVYESGVLVTAAAQGLDFVGAALALQADGTVEVTVTGGGVNPGTPSQIPMYDGAGTNIEDSIAYQIQDNIGLRVGVDGRFNVGSPIDPSYETFLVNIYEVTGQFGGTRSLSLNVVVDDAINWGNRLLESVKVEALGSAATNGAKLWGYVTAQTLTGPGKGSSLYGVLLEDGWGDVGGAGEPAGVGTFACIRANPFGGANPADFAYAFLCDMSSVTATELWGAYITGATSFFDALGVGNFAAAAGPVGNVVGQFEIFDGAGASLGFVPVYDAIP